MRLVVSPDTRWGHGVCAKGARRVYGVRCSECNELWEEITKRMNSMIETGRLAENLGALPLDKMPAEKRKEFATLAARYQVEKAQIDGLKVALKIHRRYHPL